MSKSHNHLYRRASYKRARMRAMVRDNFTCRLCGCRHFFELTTHHLVSLQEGGANTAANLVTLCRDCHDRLHQGLAERRAMWQTEELAGELLTAALELLAA